MSAAKIDRPLRRRARNVAGHYRGLIDEFDVNNEMLHCTALSQRLGDSIFRQMCAEASGANPTPVTVAAAPVPVRAIAL